MVHLNTVLNGNALSDDFVVVERSEDGEVQQPHLSESQMKPNVLN